MLNFTDQGVLHFHALSSPLFPPQQGSRPDKKSNDFKEKDMKRRILSTLLCLCMIVSLLPMSVQAADSAPAIGSDASGGLDLYTPPTQATRYPAGAGYLLFTPAAGGTPATLVMHDAAICADKPGPALTFSSETVMKLEGTNSITNTHVAPGNGIEVYSAETNKRYPLTIEGGSGDTLSISAWQCTYIGSLTVSGATVNLNGSCHGLFASGNVLLENGAKVSARGGETGYALLVSNARYQYDLAVTGGSALTVNGKSLTGGLALSGSGTKLTVNPDAEFTASGCITVGSGAVLENNGTIIFPNTGISLPLPAPIPGQIAALHISGTGRVQVATEYDPVNGYPSAWDCYTSEGIRVIGDGTGLNLTSGDPGSKTVEHDGYSFRNNILTLGSVLVDGDVTLPGNAVIHTAGDAVIRGQILSPSGTPLNVVFNGPRPLCINGSITGFSNGDTVTVQDGAQVTVNGVLSIGGPEGLGGTLNVTGSGTSLSVSTPREFAAMCDTVNVSGGASLTAHAEGSDSVGIKSLTGVNVTTGASLTAACAIGLYITGGKLTVDDTGKLITNGSAAPFCIVDATFSKAQSAVLSLPGIPNGTHIAAASGAHAKYWSLVPENGALGISAENRTSVALTGTKTGTLTFIRSDPQNSSSQSTEPTSSAAVTPAKPAENPKTGASADTIPLAAVLCSITAITFLVCCRKKKA